MRRIILAVFALALVAPAGRLTSQPAWTVERTPILDVRGSAPDGSVVMSHPAGAIRLADGTLLVADRGENAIRVIDAAGKLQRTVGRTGQGPGEYQLLTWANRCGADSLLVWDMRRRMASMIGPSGAPARQFAIPAASDTGAPPMQLSCATNGEIAYRGQPRPDRSAGPPGDGGITPVVAAVYRASREGAITRRFGDIPAGEMLALTSPQGGRGAAPRPLGRDAQVVAFGDGVAIASADSAMITLVPATGAPRHHRLPITPRAPTREEFDAAVQELASMIPAAMRQAMAERIAASPMPARIPPISALHVDPLGMLWAQTSPASAKAVDFLVLHPDGRVAARVSVPAALTVFEIGRDFVLGSYTDAQGEPHVAVYRLRR